MAIIYNDNLIGKMVVEQKGREFEIEIRQGNCLAVFIQFYKDKNDKTCVSLQYFISDEKHLKNIIKNVGNDFFGYEKVKSIRLNTKYKETQTLIKYLPKCGYEVTCYYE